MWEGLSMMFSNISLERKYVAFVFSDSFPSFPLREWDYIDGIFFSFIIHISSLDRHLLLLHTLQVTHCIWSVSSPKALDWIWSKVPLSPKLPTTPSCFCRWLVSTCDHICQLCHLSLDFQQVPSCSQELDKLFKSLLKIWMIYAYFNWFQRRCFGSKYILSVLMIEKIIVLSFLWKTFSPAW